MKPTCAADIIGKEAAQKIELKYALRAARVHHLPGGWAVDSPGAVAGLVATGLPDIWAALDRALQSAQDHHDRTQEKAILKVLELMDLTL